MNPMYDDLPFSVNINGADYSITTDFRDWIRFADMVQEDTLDDLQKIEICLMYFDKRPRDISSAIRALIDFYACEEVPKAGKPTTGKAKPVFSYLYDAGYVLAAFRQVYGIDLRTIEYMHWYEFRWLFDALPENIPLRERINYRSVNLSSIKDNKERGRVRRIQRAIELPNTVKDTDIGDVFGGMM